MAGRDPKNETAPELTIDDLRQIVEESRARGVSDLTPDEIFRKANDIVRTCSMDRGWTVWRA